MRKTILSLALALVLCLGLTLPVAAGDTSRAGAYVTISAGHSHTGAVDQNGTLWMWGSNKNYRLGDLRAYDTEYWLGNYQSVPKEILDNVVSVSCGNEHTAAIKSDGSLWMWGSDAYGQIGVGGNVSYKGDISSYQYDPIKVMDGVVAVSCGEDFTAAIKTDGSLWTWGNNMSGRLGNGGGGNAETRYEVAIQNVPLKVMDNVAAVSCGWNHAAAIKTDGTLWTWGDGSYFKLGNGLASNIYDTGVHGENQLVPIKVMDGVAAVSCGRLHTAAIKTDGSLWAWGNNPFGQVGSGSSNYTNFNNACQSTPIKIMDDAATVSCGEYFTAAVKTDGSLWTWGMNWNGELGNGGKGNVIEDAERRTIHQTVPVKVMDGVAAVSCGNSYTVAIKADGSLWTCGGNYNGQLGNGNQGNFHSTTWPDSPSQDVFGKVMDNIKVPKSNVPSIPATPSVQSSIAYASTQTVQVDGRPVEFQMYALKDQTGNPTNYVKVRDVAYALNGTAAQFNVTWDGAVNLVSKSAYVSNGSEMSTPYAGDRAYKAVTSSTKVNGVATNLDAFTLTDDNGGGYTYYKLRDLGMALGFNVGWSAEQGIYIETNRPYQG